VSKNPNYPKKKKKEKLFQIIILIKNINLRKTKKKT